MGKVLIAYTTNAGSTQKVAETIGKELASGGLIIEVHRLEEVATLDGYSAAIIGGPMILGWHRGAVRFVKQHRTRLSQMPVAYFMTAIALTSIEGEDLGGLQVALDPDLAKTPGNSRRLSLKEGYTRVKNYLKPVIKAGPEIKPLSIAFFGGKLDMRSLKFWQMIFVLLIVGAQPGDFRNWPFIKEWAHQLSSRLEATSM
jgi:menaquinone-dependent protoporphyrinogen IX oxidase